jgi:hypothetical protein
MLMFIGMTVGGSLGWWAGEALGFELMGAFLVSVLGSAVGVYLGWKVGLSYFDN